MNSVFPKNVRDQYVCDFIFIYLFIYFVFITMSCHIGPRIMVSIVLEFVRRKFMNYVVFGPKKNESEQLGY